MTDAGTSIRISDVRTIGVPVSDQERALEFYGRVLGFETRMDGSFPGGRWIEVAAPGATTTIASRSCAPRPILSMPARARICNTPRPSSYDFLIDAD